MKLRRIKIGRMPGINRPFELVGLDGGLNLVTGPNGSGKSTLCRAVRALLWPASEPLDAVSLTGEWDDEGESLRVEREQQRTRWSRDGAEQDAPVAPDAALARCFNLGVRDLLLDADATDTQVAREILRQISGGYDLRQVQAEQFTTKPMAGKAEEKEVNRLVASLRESRHGQQELARREEHKQALEKQLAEARQANETQKLLEAARRVAVARHRLGSLDEELAGFPQGMDRLNGDEPERLKQSEADLVEVREELASRCESARIAAVAIEDCRLPDGPVDEADLVAWIDQARALRGVEERITAADQDLTSARAALEHAAAELGSEASPGREIRLDAEALASIDGFLRRGGVLRAKVESLRAEMELTAEDEPEAGPSLRDLEVGRDLLVRWLAAGEARQRLGAPWLLTFALLAAIAGTIAAQTHHPAWWLLAGAGAGGLMLLAWLLLGASGVLATTATRREFEQLSLDPPDVWERAQVREALRGLDETLAAHERRVQRRARATRAEEQLHALEGERRELDTWRDRLRSSLGVDPNRVDLDLALLAQRIETHRAAAQRRDEARAILDLLRNGRAGLLDPLNAVLREFGEPEGTTAAALEAGLARLKDRSRDLAAAVRSLVEAEQREAELTVRMATLEGRVAGVYRRAGLECGDRDELDRRLSSRERFVALTREAEKQRDLVAEGRAELAGRDDLLALSPEQAQAHIEAVRELAEKVGPISAEIGAIEKSVADARASDARQTLAAQREATLEQLARRREERFAATAGSVLLDEIRDEYDLASRPEVLRRAEHLFALFTRNRYGLRFDSSAERSVFSAVEASTGDRKTLAQLSEGTHVQLLLAARLAFASGLDRANRIPLFLDEVLTTSDPERFAAIAGSLTDLVEEEGRQVFYLTANPADIARWNRLLQEQGKGPLHAVDLGAVRELSAAAPSAEDLVAEPRPSPLAPDGLDAAEYGKRLRVPAVDVDRPADELHLFHLLNDDLSLLHRLLVAGIETVGQWRLLAGRGEAATLLGETIAARMSALANLYEAFHGARRIGRGRRVEMEALRRSGHVSTVFLQKFPPLVKKSEGDARWLMETIEAKGDERARGFRTTAAEQLREWLEREGYIDERPSLDLATINAHVLTALAGEVEAKRLTDAEVARRVESLFQLSGGKNHGASRAGGGRDAPEAPTA